MFVLKKKYTELEERLHKAEEEINWLESYKSKADMKFSVIEKWVKEAQKGLLAKNRLLNSIIDLLNQ